MKFLPGPIMTAMSGSIGGTTYSHNKGGQYMRARSMPTLVTSSAAMNAKSYLATASTAWQALTAAQRLSWTRWAQSTPVADKLRQSLILSGHQAFVKLNTRRQQLGLALLTAPPADVQPEGLVTLSGTYDIGAGNFTVVFTPSPLGATNSLWLYAAVLKSAGKSYVQNLLRLVYIGAADTASGVDPQTNIEARLGTLVVGDVVVYQAHVINRDTGLVSTPLRTQGTVVST